MEKFQNNHKFIIPIIFFLFWFFLSACGTVENKSNLRKKYPNLLNIQNIPDSRKDLSSYFFSDRGAWFGFGLPSESDSSYFGSFAGPYLLDQQKWFSKSCLNFNIYIDGSKLPLKNCKVPEINYYPGILIQRYRINKTDLRIKLIYISKNSILVKVILENNSDSGKSAKLELTGKSWLKNITLTKKSNAVQYKLENNKRLKIKNLNSKSTLKTSDKRYKIVGKEKQINNQEKFVGNYIVSYSGKNETSDVKRYNSSLNYFNRNKVRWNSYIENILMENSDYLKSDRYKKIAIKSLETLVLNWRSPQGDLNHSGLFPSSSVDYFNGFWAWDSWKHSVALAKFAPELAKQQIYTMFDYQNKKGMIPDCIYENKKDNNWRNTKPPLSTWAVWKIFKETGDKEFLVEMFSQLVKYHDWWYKFRDHDNNGLCEYGSTDGTLIAAKWESGMDNAVRFDSAKILKNGENAYSLNQESVDLNSYLYAEKQYLLQMAKKLDQQKFIDSVKVEAKQLGKKIREQMYDRSTGYFYDIKFKNNKKINTKDPAGWIPLWANLATEVQAEKVANNILDTTQFNTYYPFPTVAKSNSKFSQKYWRGPVWLDQAYFGVKAMRNYGYTEQAHKLTRKLLDNANGISKAGPTIRENYWPLNGKGLNAHNFSWSAAHFLMLLWQ